MIDDSVLTEKQLAQVRQIVREEVTIVAEAVAAEVIGARLEGLPTTNQVAEMFERWLQQMHEMLNSADISVRRVESKIGDLGEIKREIGKLTASVDLQNNQLTEVQRNIQSIDDKADTQGEAQVDLRGKYQSLQTMIFGDPSSPNLPSLAGQLNERSHRADEQHEEIKKMLTDELKPMLTRANERLVAVEVFIAKQREWLKRGQAAIEFLGKNPGRWAGVIFGGGTITAVTLKVLEVVSHWTR